MTELPRSISSVDILSFGRSSGSVSQPGPYVFSYREDAAYPCSLTMPLRPAPYTYGQVHPVFAQNLPEGYVRRYISERLARHAKVNDLYLLALQQDLGIGHISTTSEIPPQRAEHTTLDEILNWQGEKPLFEQLLDKYYLRSLLSGVQPKVLVPLNERATIAQQNVIVKTFDEEFDLLTVNEFVCMSAAKAVGLKPPNFWLSRDQRNFVIERFDVKDDQKLAFEDFTVLTGKDKYSGSYETFLRAVLDYTKSIEQVALAYRMIVLNCLIGNGDAHLKNFAVQYDASRSEVRLTPPYDITHTLIYPTIDNRMALKIDGARNFPDKKALIKLGKVSGIKKPELICQQIADLLSDFILSCEHISAIPGFKQSLQKALATGTKNTAASYRRDINKKHN